jgi:4-hydroxy-tetrahydrodipicolinate synthase
MKLPGLIVAPLTPFKKSDLSVDWKALEREIDYICNDCKAAMVSVAGVETSEYHYLSFADRKQLIKRTAEFVGTRSKLVVGVSHPNTRTVMELIELAHGLGAEAAQVLAPQRPYGGQPGTQELVDYFGAIADKSPMPLLLYLNPGPGAEVGPDATVAITKIDKVKYVKESSRDLARVSRLIVEIDHAGHARYFTTMQMLLATLMLGGSGATMPPPGCYIASKIIDAFNAKDYEKAAKLQLEFALFPSKWMAKGLAPVMKAAMEIIDRPLGDPYPPFPAFTAEEKKGLAAHLKSTCLFRKDA